MKKYLKLFIAVILGVVAGFFLRPCLPVRKSTEQFPTALRQIGRSVPEGCEVIHSYWKHGLRASGGKEPQVWTFHQSLDVSKAEELSEGYKPRHGLQGSQHDLVERISKHYHAQIQSIPTSDFMVIDHTYNSSFGVFTTALQNPGLINVYILYNPFIKNPEKVGIYLNYTPIPGFKTFNTIEKSEEYNKSLNEWMKQ